MTIVRDSRGEPHIRAGGPRGAAYGLGYAQMQDQATYILTTMAKSTGRSAELIGPGCAPDLQACFTQDQLTHLFLVPETAYSSYSDLPVDTRNRLSGFADGINAYVDSGGPNLPPWAFHVTPQDVLANLEWGFVFSEVAHVLDPLGAGAGAGAGAGGEGAVSSDSPVAEAAAALADEGTPAMADAIPGQLTDTASNMFALAGSKTTSGEPIVEGNPHLGWDGVFRWYGAQLSYPGERIQGYTFRGFPGIALGSNDHVAWSLTANHGSQHEQDAYVETLNPQNPDQYLYGGTYRDMGVRHISIGVKQADGNVQIPVTLRYAHHGPILTDPAALIDGTQAAPSGATAIAGKVSQLGESGIATEFTRVGEADSVAELRQALSLNQLSTYNLVAGDDAGHIYYVASSRSGILKPGRGYNTIFDGTDPDNDWQGILPFDQLPQAQDPVSGYYENANNGPWFTAPDQIQQGDLPFYLRTGGNGTRSRRQIQILGSQTSLSAPMNLTLPDVEQIGFDTYLEIGPALRALLDQAAADPGADPKVVQAAALVDAWPGAPDLEADASATAVPLFSTWVRGLDKGALGFAPLFPPDPSTTFTAVQKAEARRAMIVAYNGMTAEYGTIAKPYGDLHTFTWGSVSGPIDGGDSDVASLFMTNCKGVPGTTSPVYYHPCPSRGGTSVAFNVSLANGRFTVVRPVPDTDDPASPFYSLNAQDFISRTPREYPVSDAAVDSEATSSQTRTLPGAALASVDPGALDFGSELVGTSSAPRAVTVRNDGSGYLYLGDASIGGAGAGSFATAVDGCSERPVAPGQRCALSVSFTPASAGSLAASLSIPDTVSSREVALSGTGTVAPTTCVDRIRPTAGLRVAFRGRQHGPRAGSGLLNLRADARDRTCRPSGGVAVSRVKPLGLSFARLLGKGRCRFMTNRHRLAGVRRCASRVRLRFGGNTGYHGLARTHMRTRLAPGRYRAWILVRDGAGNRRTVTRDVRVVRAGS